MFCASKGLKVLCLEAGRMIEPHKDFHNHKLPYRWPYRGRTANPGNTENCRREWNGK